MEGSTVAELEKKSETLFLSIFQWSKDQLVGLNCFLFQAETIYINVVPWKFLWSILSAETQSTPTEKF